MALRPPSLHGTARLLLVGAALAAPLGLSACGGDDLTRDEIAQRVDESAADPLAQDGLSLEERQAAADADVRDAQQSEQRARDIAARREAADEQRRQEAAEAERQRQAALAEVERRRRQVEAGASAVAAAFRGEVAAACSSASGELDGLTDQARRIARSTRPGSDAANAAGGAAAFASGVELLTGELRKIRPPSEIRRGYREWVGAIAELGDAVGALADAASPARLASVRARIERAAQQVEDGRRALGVVCDV